MYATIIGNDTFLQMDVTTDWGRSLNGTPTDNPVESGATIADHYYLNPETFTLNGSVSFIKTGYELNDLDPKDWDSKIRALMQSRQPFSVSLDDKFTPPINNCVITNYSINRSTALDAIGISLSFQQVIVAARAREVSINVVAGANGDGDLTGAGKDGGSSGSKTAKVLRTTTLFDGSTAIIDLGGQVVGADTQARSEAYGYADANGMVVDDTGVFVYGGRTGVASQ